MSALSEMVAKLDNRQPGTRGYVTQVPELQRILSEITPLVSVGISEDYLDVPGEVSVTITLGLTLERNLL
jgi:hypothetical protein